MTQWWHGVDMALKRQHPRKRIRQWLVPLVVATALLAAACGTVVETGATPTITATTTSSPVMAPEPTTTSVPVLAETTTTTTTTIAWTSAVWDDVQFVGLGSWWLVPQSTLVVRVSAPVAGAPTNGSAGENAWTLDVDDAILGSYSDQTIEVVHTSGWEVPADAAILFLVPFRDESGELSPDLWQTRYVDASIVTIDLDFWGEALALAEDALGLMWDNDDVPVLERRARAVETLMPLYSLYGRMPLSTEDPSAWDYSEQDTGVPPEPGTSTEGSETTDLAETPLVVELEDRTVVFSNWFFMLLDGTATVRVLGSDGEVLVEGPVVGESAVMREVGVDGGDFEFFDGATVVAFMTQEELMAAIRSATGISAGS